MRIAFCALWLVTSPALAQPSRPSELPRVVLIGDSIRLGYAPLVAKRLEGKAVVISAKENGGDSANVLKHLDAWVIEQKPDLVHLNCGLHDLKFDRASQKYQVSPEAYEANLRAIVERVRAGTKAAIVFANTTPIIDDRHAARKAGFDRREADVTKYNAIAERAMAAMNVPVHDLHTIARRAGVDAIMTNDGTHFTPGGSELLAAAVADSVLRNLSIAKAKPQPPALPNKEAAASYRNAEAAQDALVPAKYKSLAVGKFLPPATAEDWKSQRAAVKKIVVDSLGELPPRPATVKSRLISRELRPGYSLEHIAIDNGMDEEIGALLLIPAGLKKPAPAVMWLHSSSPDKTQVVTPHSYGGETPFGEELVKAGFIVFAPDACWYGDRAGTGPAGAAETARAQHESLFKFHLWMGRTLWGVFVRDDQCALDYLVSRPEVDASRIGATGMSMGSTRSWWLAAVDDRIACVVATACMTRYENLIRHGQLRQHGVYYFTNGLLKHFDSEGVLALIAPRPLLILTGDLDAGSPADGIRVIDEKVSQVFATLGAKDRFRNILYPDIGHVVTPEMRRETIAWFDRWLKK
jgi:lysophospholipase L1-like esterase/dienelactone hydrolase